MTSSPAPRWANGFLWLAPIAFCLWQHWYALKSWFWSDDFAWLGLHTNIYDRATFFRVMFAPFAQGTIRPWSERGFFLLFYKLFGLDALPYHAMVFATQAANLLLLAWIIRKVSGSAIAGALAGVLWCANSSLVTPMGWASDYNQIQCTFFLLAAFALFLAGHYWFQVAVFIVGFGALEINIVYPALLLAWLVLSRKSVKPAIPLVAISIAYFLIHRSLAPMQASGPYELRFNLEVLHTFATYWKWMAAPQAWLNLPGHRSWMATAASVLLTLGVAVFVIRAWRRQDRVPAFFFLWYLITIAPILPLPNHITDYYLAIPSLGISVILALEAGRLPGRTELPAGLLILGFLFIHVPATRFADRWYFERSREVRSLVMGVIEARKLHPDQAIMLTEVSAYLYATSLAHSPFHVVGIDRVYLSPDTKFSGYANLVPPSDHVLEEGPTLRALAYDQIQVYRVGGYELKNVTSTYKSFALQNFSQKLPSRLDIGNPLVAYLLGSTWYPLEGIHRWMPQTATIRIAAPQTSNARLFITGYCTQEQTRLGPLRLTISVNGKKVSEIAFNAPEIPFSRSIDLPADSARKESMDLMLEVSRTFQGGPGDRPLGLAFGTFEVR